MIWDDDSPFCNSSFWDPELLWDSPDPEFTPCFEKTVLVWAPCLFLWVFSPLEVYYILQSRCRDVPWGFLNTCKVLKNLLLIALSTASLVRALVIYFTSGDVFPVDIWTPVIQIATFTLALVFLLWNKLRGLQTSGVLFVFWLLLSVAGLSQLRSEFRRERRGELGDDMFGFIVYMIYYPLVVLMFLFNFFSDKQPRKTNYPRSKKLCPEVEASFASRLIFRWLDPLVWKGYRRPLTVEDLWDLRHQDKSSQITPPFQKCWDQQSGNACNVEENGISKTYGTMEHTRTRRSRQVNVLRPIFRTFWKLFAAGGTCRVVGDLFSFASPQILSLMMKFVASDEYMWRGIVYALGLFLASEMQTFFYHHNLMTMSVLGLNIRTAVISAIYRKSLRISSAARRESPVGEVVNLMAVDAQRFIDFSAYFNLIYAAPIIIAIAMYFLWELLGPSAFAGLAVMVVLVPINITIANKVKSLQMRQMKYKDERVKLMNEVLSGVKVLKLYAWEPSFEQQIRKIREHEVTMLKKAALLNASISFLWACSPFLVSLTTLGVYVMSDDSHILTAEVAFVAASLFNLMKNPINMFPQAVQILVQTLVSTKRINRFLNAEELDLHSVSRDTNERDPLVMDSATLSWGTENSDQPILRNISLRVRKGSLVAVVGAVGSGKSSLISAFLGEMDKISGHINTTGRIAYVPQQAWIQNATVKNNILFGIRLDQKRYQSTIEACALVQDFEMLPGGDATEIGEKGINLSGGQKQRVSLARAVYNDADTYLLDDPLSAVDSHVGKHIFENVIGPKGVLSKKTRLLVTHGVTFLPKVDIIVVLKDGEVSEIGTFKELLAKRGEFSEFLVQHITETEESELEPDIEELVEENPLLKAKLQNHTSSVESVRSGRSGSFKKSRSRIDSSGSEAGRSVKAPEPVNQLIQIEKAETGSVKLGVYGSYIRSFGFPLALGFMTCMLLFQALSVGANAWLSVWTNDGTAVVDGVQDTAKRDYYLEVYMGFGLGQLVATWASAFLLAFGSVLASKLLHWSMLVRVLRAPMSFFDTTPLGRIVNRFSKDIDIVDNTLPGNLNSAINCFVSVAGTLVVIIWSTPVYIFAVIPLGILYILIQRFYIAASRQLKRIESVTRSPIYSHFSETVSGASSVRAYGVEERFIRTSEDRVDLNQMCLYPSQVSNRWLGVRLETVGNLMIFFAALFAVLGRDTLNAGIVGLSISYALQITGVLNYAVRQASEVETNIVSVERISEYSHVPQEAPWQLEFRPPSDWPSNGAIHFQDYQVRYREDLELVLRGITVTIVGGEKVGIVGRTGAGKSSLTLCLFRILEAAGGSISIDGIDIAKMGLGDLRSKLTIIPQDPVLFSGSLRMNLDPFEKYSDSDIWGALQHAHLSDFARGLAAGLNHTITEGGDNVSVGQRQLICLARALLRKTKVLILDEATAAIDLETDDLIQQTIRREFKDCTVLTIAHRLNTIMDSDRVLVLDKGMVKEFDSPSNLLKSETTIFYGMAKDAGLVLTDNEITQLPRAHCPVAQDPATSWDTEDPDLSLCFEKTVLTWTPCLFLWLATPLEVLLIHHSKCGDIPWRAINILKLVGNIVLVAVSAVSLAWSGINSQEENIYPVDIWTPVIKTATFLLTTVLMLWNRVRGRHTSGVLFFFWLLLAIGGAMQFRTELRLSNRGIPEESNFNFILYMIYYPVVVMMFILNLFPDPPPRETNYPQSKKLCPEVHASFASRIIFRWFDCLIWKGFKKPLTVADLWDLRFQDTAGQVLPKFEKYWFRPPATSSEDLTAKNGKTSSYGTLTNVRNRSSKPITIMGPTLKVLWVSIFIGGVVKLLGDMMAFVNPQILNVMIKFVAGKEFMWRGVLYAVGMFVAAELQTIFFHQGLMVMYIVGLNWRTALMSAIYRKALRMSNSARKTSTVGEVVNLMAVDAQRCADFAPFAHMTWTSPITIVVALYFLWQILGPSTLAGLAVMVIIIPVNTFIANKVKFLQIKQMKYKDERVKLMNEILSGIKVLKLYAWEPSFRDYILKIREKELKLMRRAALLNASTSFVWGCSSFLVSLATFGVYVLLDERNVLTVEIAFVASALFNVMRAAISFFPMMIQLLVQSIVSVKRINNFLNAEELDFNSVSHDESKKEPLIIEGGSFSWGTESTDAAILRNITLRVKPGSLVAVVGAVGSGKSSLISAFLGEMDKISGYVNTKGSIAYVPQQAWIQNATVRDNIVFSSTYDSKRYHKTIETCSLRQDLDMLPGGDRTEIGEKGINLSGGQKQRVSLARAVYNDADTYLLDDPLSAVDSHVGKHIFENVIGPKGVLSKKTRVMVTHGVTFLPHVDEIVVMRNGEIIETGTFKELLGNKGEFSNFLVQHITESEDIEVEGELEELIEEHPALKVQIQRQLSKSGSVRSSSSNVSHRKTSSVSEENIQTLTSQIDKLIQAEKTETGSVKMSVYMHYLKSAGLFLSLATLGFQLFSQALGIAANIWLSDWTSDTSAAVQGVQDKDKRNFYLEVYTALGFGQMAAVVAGAYALAFGTILASRGLHQAMLSNIIHCPMSFFDTTPTGRLVNRFGKDVDVIDNTLPFTFSTALTGFGNVIGTIVVITYSTPLFATVILPIGLVYYAVQKVYITTSRQLKRIESVSRSPVYSHFSETVSGATSIRAYNVVDRFIKTSEDRVDANQVCLYPSLVANRWLGIRLETVGNALIFFAALFAVLGRDTLDAGLVGLSISYALQITGMLNISVRMSSEVETNIVSVERIKEYSEVPTEAAWVVEPRPEPQWPSHGTVQFQDYQVRYREGLDLVLRGVSFVVNGGEKIGIVGRTGAGKSSLTLCLFRILEAAGGSIYIDGLDIAKIGLGDLRSKLTIIPQDPVLFSGSLRMNLDPFEKYSDSDIWGALQHAHLSDFARGLAAGLNHTITEGGDNLSVGQRQLICLARALLRKTKVLILDEATAAIDLETDDLIQQTIRREFKDCTVLTIAHRLNTIMDSDRVIVLDKGTIKEFDSPASLLSSVSTVFYGMAKDAGLV